VVRAHKNSSCEVAPVRTPPPGRSGEAMERMHVFGVFLDSLDEGAPYFAGKVRMEAAVSVSVVMIRILRLGGDVRFAAVGSGLLMLSDSANFSVPLSLRRPWPLRFTYSVSSICWVVIVLFTGASLFGPGSLMSSLFSLPFLALAFEARRAGMVLLMICFACFARMSFRTEGGARPWDFSVRPIVGLLDQASVGLEYGEMRDMGVGVGCIVERAWG
jgi:hypothetical protein